MSIVEIEAILTKHAIAAPTPNKDKGNRLEFYALLAYPPAAIGAIQAVCEAAADGAPLGSFEISLPTNGQRAKPIPGIPADWYIVRASTQFAPYLARADGKQLVQDTQQGEIRTVFFAGKKVRGAISGYAWTYGSKKGISFNLDGLMEIPAESTRLPIGSRAEAMFAQHAQPGAIGTTTQTNPGNVFGGHIAPAAQSANVGAGTVPNGTGSVVAAGANPFVQAAGGAPAGGANPFL